MGVRRVRPRRAAAARPRRRRASPGRADAVGRLVGPDGRGDRSHRQGGPRSRGDDRYWIGEPAAQPGTRRPRIPRPVSPPTQQEGRSPRSPSSNMASKCVVVAIFLAGNGTVTAEEPGRTTLSDPAIRYTVPEKPYVVLRGGTSRRWSWTTGPSMTPSCPGIAPGTAAWPPSATRRRENLFVPAFAGLNFEHIHDGTTRPARSSSNPGSADGAAAGRRAHRRAVPEAHPDLGPGELHTYELLPDGAIEMTVECIPRRRRASRTATSACSGRATSTGPNRARSTSWAIPRGATRRAGSSRPRPRTASGRRTRRRRRSVVPARRRLPAHPRLQPLGPSLRRALVLRRQPRHGLCPGLPGPRPGAAGAIALGRREREPGLGLPGVPPRLRGGPPLHPRHAALYLPYESPEQVRRAVEPHRLALERP